MEFLNEKVCLPPHEKMLKLEYTGKSESNAHPHALIECLPRSCSKCNEKPLYIDFKWTEQWKRTWEMDSNGTPVFGSSPLGTLKVSFFTLSLLNE